MWRRTGDIVLAQQLLRESPATTAAYLHPTRDDLDAALAALDEQSISVVRFATAPIP